MHAVEQLVELLPVERLLLQERTGEAVERGAMLREQPDRLVVRRVGEQGLFGVAEPLRLLGQRIVVGAVSNSLRIRAAPRPANIPMKADALCE